MKTNAGQWDHHPICLMTNIIYFNPATRIDDKTNDKTRLIKPQNDAQSLSATCRTSVCEVLGWMGMNALSKDVHEPGEACDA